MRSASEAGEGFLSVQMKMIPFAMFLEVELCCILFPLLAQNVFQIITAEQRISLDFDSLRFRPIHLHIRRMC